MMRGNNILGILFANVHEEKIRELTEKRTMGSVPFGGRYRLIDFPLSNLVNSGINKGQLPIIDGSSRLRESVGPVSQELRPVYASAVWPRIPGQQQSD